MHKDDEGFRSFAAARLGPLYRAALLLCGDPYAAEDLVQETLTGIYVVWGTRSIDDPAAYAAMTLTRVFLSAHRRRSAGERPVEELPERADTGPDLAARLDLQRALARLSPRDRAIVVLRYLDDWPVDDVAAAVRISPGNVRVRASRALRQLRRDLAPDPAPAESTPQEPKETCRD